MPSPLGSFLLTLSSESQHSVDSGEATIQIFVSDNAKMMRRASCASYSSSDDIGSPDVADAINVARKVETKRTNWERLCSPISERRASVRKRTLSLPLRKLSNDNIASMANKQSPRRSQSVSLSNKRTDSVERLLRGGSGRNAYNAVFAASLKEKPATNMGSGRNAYNAVFAASLKEKPATNMGSISRPIRIKVSNDDMPGLSRNNYASTSTENTTSSIPLQGKINPFTAIFPTASKEKDLNRPLECPQRKPSAGDHMFSMMNNSSRNSLRTPSNQGNASFDTESLKWHGKRALLNPFKTLVDSPTKARREHQ
jgi:hypothetical protein